IYAALAEKERALISRRTKDALAAARARGIVLGGLRDKGRELQAEAEARAEALRPVFEEISGLGHRAAARALNERGIPTANGGPWSAVTVTRVRQRLVPRGRKAPIMDPRARTGRHHPDERPVPVKQAHDVPHRHPRGRPHSVGLDD